MILRFQSLLLLLALFSGCKQETEVAQKTAEKKKEVREATVPDSLRKNSVFIAENENGFFTLFVDSEESRGKYFYADTLNVIMAETYIAENGRDKKTASAEIFSNEWSYLTIDSTNIRKEKIKGRDFLFFSGRSSNMGKAVPEQQVVFWAINLNDVSENYGLSYFGYPGNFCDTCIKGAFEENEKLRKNPEILKALQKYAKKSPLIYHPAPEESDMSNFRNYEEKWQQDNQQSSQYGAGFIGEMEEVKSTYYKENLFEINGGSEQSIENDLYILISYFRGNLVAYDKVKKRYFPVVIESCSYFCNKSIEFSGAETVRITYEDGSVWELDLTKVQFSN